jgi:hypothetical protein
MIYIRIGHRSLYRIVQTNSFPIVKFDSFQELFIKWYSKGSRPFGGV